MNAIRNFSIPVTFGAPEWLWGLLLLPFLLLLFLKAERKSAERLRAFASARLLPDLTGQVDRFRRALRFFLQIIALGLALVSLAKPRWGYTVEEAHRKGIDLLVAVDTSRSMLSNDVQPSRLERVKLATQDLIGQLQGDRIGLIAFAGRAFVQAPLTIDYDAVAESVRDLNTQTIPEGGTNISEAIQLATKTYGKSATGNRALIIFTDGEDLSGDAVRAAKDAAGQGVKIFTVGVGTPQGSLIPITGEDYEGSFVKDAKGQVVKSKLDEKRLREIGEATGGTYLHLENGPRTMQQLISEGIAGMQAGDIDVRLNRRPIERYEWPLGLGVFALATALFLRERKKQRASPVAPAPAKVALAAAFLLAFSSSLFSAAPGLDAYREGRFDEAFGKFQETLQAHPQTPASDRLNFDAGAAAYKMKQYGKAMQSFSQALLSKDVQLQEKTHYNLGNTLYEQGEAEKTDEKKLSNWTNALQHYDETLKLAPQNKEAKENREFVKNKIEELKNKKPNPTPTPSPTPPQNNQQKKDDKKDQGGSGQKDQQSQSQQQKEKDSKGDKKQDQQQQSDNKDQKGSDQKPNDKEQAKDKNEKKDGQGSSPSPTASPSPGESPGASPSPSSSPSSSPGQSPSPDKKDGSEEETPSPSPSASDKKDGDGNSGDQQQSPSPIASATPPKKFSGDIKGSSESQPQQSPQPGEAENEPDGRMSERQALALLQSIRDEEARVPLDERRAARRVYNDW